MIGGTGFGLIGSWKAHSQRSHLLSLGITQPCEGQALLDQQSPKLSKHQMLQTKKMINT